MKKQAGIALFVCLIILLVLSLLGITAMRMMTSQNMIASSSQGAELAFDAAETGINQALMNAQAAMDASGSLPTVAPGEVKEYLTFKDAKGITTTTVTVSLVDEMDESTSQAVMRKQVEMGAVPGLTASQYRFTATSNVEALGVSTTHVQHALIYSL